MRAHHAVVAGLLGLFVVCGIASLVGDSATFDETAHLGAGVSYLETGDFRLNPEHPPLAKLIAAVPVKALGRGGGNYESAAWTNTVADEWVFGFELINGPVGAPARRDPALRLVPARLAMMGLGLMLCLVIYAWARELYGPAAALAALALAVSCPTILAHARLVTTDLPGALGSVATMWAFWRWSLRPDWCRATIASVALAAALLFKFSTILLIPSVLVLGGFAIATGRVRAKQAAGAVALMAALSFAAIWGAYGFRFPASLAPGRSLDWSSLSAAPASPIVFARDRHLLPEAYLYGIAYAKAEASGRTGFLDGEESNAGWYRYFPEAFLFKTPLPFLALVLWVVGVQVRRSRGRSFDGWCIALVPLALAILAVASRFNIGHRHLAPVYPFLCVAAAPVGEWIVHRGRRAIAAGALILGCGVSFALATPGYLSYFNVLGGGARNGWRHFVDSNIDWGQDLARLKRWMDANGAANVDLAYFGTADPKAYGIDFNKVALFLDFSPDMPVTRPEPGRLLAASVTMLQGVYLDSDRALATELLRRRQLARGDIDTYLADRRGRDARGDAVEHLGPWIVERGLLTAEQVRDAAETLPGTWLARARDEWTPIARAGDSILIYRAK